MSPTLLLLHPVPKRTCVEGVGRNSEKRRERSKFAARDRRSKESEIFSELSQYLPLPESTRNSLDKASVMRLSLSDLKLRAMMEKTDKEFSCEPSNGLRKKAEADDLEPELGTLMNNAMGGFVLVLSTEGDIIYVSESVTTHLGLSQVEVMGLNIYDFSHPCDHADIRELLFVNKKNAEEDDTGKRSGAFRMKCTITERGRNVHIRAATYKVIDFTGRMLPRSGEGETARWFVGIGEPLLHASDVDIPLNKQTFLTKHTPDMKCEFVDDSIGTFLGYRPEDMIGKSIFEFHHASDGPALAKAFKSLYVKGQSVTERYRFLAKHGGWVWVVTQATLIQSSNGMKPNSIVCLNFITSGIENENEIVSGIQSERPVGKPFAAITPNFKSPTLVPVTTKEEVLLEQVEKENILPQIPANKPIPSTTKIFAPRTDDMDSGFLMPCDDRLIVSKEEPEDLTHLAPIAGDESVPLALPLIDNLLKSLDAANMEYTMRDYIIDVNADDLPPLTGQFPTSSSPMTDSEEGDFCGETISLRSSSSPLFLQSDPHMVCSPDSKSSLLSPFQQLSPTPSNSRSNSYTCSSSMSPNLEHSPYSLGEESTNNYVNSHSPVPALVRMQEVPIHSAFVQFRHCASNPISANALRNNLSMGFSQEGMSSCSSSSSPIASMIRTLPVDDVMLPDPAISVVDSNELLWLQDFTEKELSNSHLTRAPNEVVETCQILFGNDTSNANSKNIAMNSSFVPSNLSAALPPGGTIEQRVLHGHDSWSWNPTVAQKRPHEVFTIKSELANNFPGATSCAEPRLAKQPKLTGLESSFSTAENPTNILNSTTALDTNSGGNVCNNETFSVVVPVAVSSSNNYTSNGQYTLSAKASSGPPPIENEKSFAEIDLKAYIQNLLSSGRNDIINALFKELSNYRKECSSNQATMDPNIRSANSEESGTTEPSNIIPEDKLLVRDKLKRDSGHEGSSLFSVIGLCPRPPTAKALVELTTLDCEVNAPANEDSSHTASELMREFDDPEQLLNDFF